VNESIYAVQQGAKSVCRSVYGRNLDSSSSKRDSSSLQEAEQRNGDQTPKERRGEGEGGRAYLAASNSSEYNSVLHLLIIAMPLAYEKRARRSED
jgi:hypothetical protein